MWGSSAWSPTGKGSDPQTAESRKSGSTSARGGQQPSAPSISKIASDFDVSLATVTQIARAKTWKHLEQHGNIWNALRRLTAALVIASPVRWFRFPRTNDPKEVNFTEAVPRFDCQWHNSNLAAARAVSLEAFLNHRSEFWEISRLAQILPPALLRAINPRSLGLPVRF